MNTYSELEKIIIDNPYQTWNKSKLSENPNISLSFIKSHTEYPFIWDWGKISLNPSITCDDIDNNPELPWVYSCISSNPNLTIKFIKKKNR